MSVLAYGASQHPAVAVHCLHTVSKKDVTGEDAVSLLKWDRKQGRSHLLPSESKWCDQHSCMRRGGGKGGGSSVIVPPGCALLDESNRSVDFPVSGGIPSQRGTGSSCWHWGATLPP